MDPISFAIGVVSLTSMVSTCIEGFNIFKSIRGYEDDAETIKLKLDIERELFILWAYNAGLLKKHYVNVKMFTPETDQVIYNTVVKTVKLLKEVETLARKYGLIVGKSWKSCFDSDKTMTMTTGEWCHCDRHRMKHRHRPSPSRPGDDTGSSNAVVAKTPLSRKFMWTIHTKDEFESLIEQLHYFIERLDQMVKSVSQRQMLLKDVRGLGADFSKLDLIEANGDDDKWSVQSSDGRNVTHHHHHQHQHKYLHPRQQRQQQHDGNAGGYEDDWSDVMTAFAGCGGRQDQYLTARDTSGGERTGHRRSRSHPRDNGGANGHSNSNSNSKNSPRPTSRRSGRHRNDHDHDEEPPPPYTSTTSLSQRPRSSPSSKTAIYTLSDHGRGRSSSNSSSSSRRPNSKLLVVREF